MSWGEDTTGAASRTTSSQDAHFPGQFPLSQNNGLDPVVMSAAKLEETYCSEDKRHEAA